MDANSASRPSIPVYVSTRNACAELAEVKFFKFVTVYIAQRNATYRLYLLRLAIKGPGESFCLELLVH